MKKIAAILLMLVLCVGVGFTVFTSCVRKALPNFEVPEEGFDTETPVTITFYHNMGQTLEKELDSAIAAFGELYPNITIEKHKLGTYNDLRDQITTQLGNSMSPNLAYCYPDHVATYNESRMVVTLDNLINSEIEVKRADGTTEILGYTKEQIDDFVEVFYEEGKCFGDDLMYLMPLSKSTEIMYYNQDFFDAHSDVISVPDHWIANGENDKTSVEYVCEKILEISREEGTAVVPLGYDSEDNWFITLAAEMGAGYTEYNENPRKQFLFDNQQNRDMMAKLREWYQKGYFTTKALNGTGEGSNTSGLLTNTTDKTSPRAYMSVGSSGGASYNIAKTNPFQTGIAPVPQIDPENPKYILQGPDVCIFKKENPQEVLASWLFLKFLTTDMDFQAGFSQVSGYMPIIKSADNDEGFKDFLSHTEGNANLQARVVKLSVQLRDKCITSPAFHGSSTAREQVGNLLVKVISEQTSDVPKLIDDAFKRAISECEYVL